MGECAHRNDEGWGFAGRRTVAAGVGSILKLPDHYALLLSGGPTSADHRTGYHFYAELGLGF
jgi:hypothetical protein